MLIAHGPLKLLMGVVAIEVMVLGIDGTLMEVSTFLNVALALMLMLAAIFVVLNIHVGTMVIAFHLLIIESKKWA